MKKINKTKSILGGICLALSGVSCSSNNGSAYSKVLISGKPKTLYVMLEGNETGAPGISKRFFDEDGDLKTVEQYLHLYTEGARGFANGPVIESLRREEMTERQRKKIDEEYQRLIKYLKE